MAGDRKVRFSAYDKLSEAGKRLLEEAVEKDWTIAKTQFELAANNDEDRIANGSLGRWMKWRRDEKEREKWANHQVHALTSAIKANDLMATEVAHSLAVSGLLEQVGSLHQVAPEKLIRLILGFNELQQKSRALDQKDAELARLQEQVDLQKRKTEALAARAKAIRERQKETERAVSKSKDIPADVKKRIREDLYGLAAEVEQNAA